MNNIAKYYFLFLVTLFFLASAHITHAAVLYILPAEKTLSPGEVFSIDIKIDSEDVLINAAQATVSWPAGVLEFTGVEKAGSVFNFWLTEPKVSSASSSLSFMGGTAKGISGAALQILKITFKARGTGIAEISISDAAITASDGEGTNILSKIAGAGYRIGTQIVQPKLPDAGPVVTPQKPIVQPVRVMRVPTPALVLPQKPVVEVPLYPDQTRWHNSLGELVVLWQVPDDVTEAAVALDHNPNTAPLFAEKELATGKRFGILEEGIWYVHVRFKNNIAWGPVAHYRIALDTKPPLAFEISFPEGESTDNPTPIVRFKTSDEFSGLKEYRIRIDEGEATSISAADFMGSFTMPLQAPGNHRLVVRAADYAENSVEDDVLLDIIPIPAPVFTFVAKELFSDQHEGLAVKGTALPSTRVLLQIMQVRERGVGEIALTGIAVADDRGNWERTFDQPLRDGKYAVTAQTQDARGAVSLVVTSETIRVKPKPILQIGPLQLGKGGVALALLAILMAGFGSGIMFYKKWQERLAMRVLFAEAEISKIFKIITEDVEKLSAALQTPTTADDDYPLERLRYNVKKMESYLKKGVEKIKR